MEVTESMKFNFKLEKVLNYKENIEGYKKNLYGTVQEKLNKEEDRLKYINQYKKNLENEKSISATKTKVGNLLMYNNYIKDISKKIENQEKLVIETRKELEEAKEEMIIAVKEKKIFEKLKEKEYEKHLYEMEKEEEKQIDSLVSYKMSTQQ